MSKRRDVIKCATLLSYKIIVYVVAHIKCATLIIIILYIITGQSFNGNEVIEIGYIL